MKRTRLSQRSLPNYSSAEERINTLTHAVGILPAIAALVFLIIRASGAAAITGAVIYGSSLIAMYAVSATYHGLKAGMAKKVMQVIDHCTIYFLIAGTYTAILLSAVLRANTRLAWGMLIFQWTLASVATALTAIDLKKYSVFSMICYIGMGWAIIPFWRQIYSALTGPGFSLLLWGGIAYTVGSVLYGLGKKRKWMHSIFHLFVLLGSFLQYLAVMFYAL